MPLSWAEAKEHGRYSNVRRIDKSILKAVQDGEDVSDRFTKTGYPKCKQYSWCHTKTQDLSDLGAGFPMYFTFLKSVMLIVLYLTLLYLPVLILYKDVNIENQSEWADGDFSLYLKYAFTAGNLGPNEDSSYTAPVVLFVAVLSVMVWLAHTNRRLRTQNVKMEIKSLQPRHYAILVKGLPKSAVSEKEISEFFETHFEVPNAFRFDLGGKYRVEVASIPRSERYAKEAAEEFEKQQSGAALFDYAGRFTFEQAAATHGIRSSYASNNKIYHKSGSKLNNYDSGTAFDDRTAPLPNAGTETLSPVPVIWEGGKSEEGRNNMPVPNNMPVLEQNVHSMHTSFSTRNSHRLRPQSKQPSFFKMLTRLGHRPSVASVLENPRVVKVVIGWDPAIAKEADTITKLTFCQQLSKYLLCCTGRKSKTSTEVDSVPHTTFNLQKLMNRRRNTVNATPTSTSDADADAVPVSTGQAVVVFRTVEDAERAAASWVYSFPAKMRNMTLGLAQPNSPKFRGVYPLTVLQAPNPTDVNWAAMNTHWARRLMLKASGYAVAILLTIIAAIAVYYLVEWTTTLRLSEEKGNLWSFVLSLIPGFCISIINLIIYTIICYQADIEYFVSNTEKDLSSTIRLTFFLLTNSALIYLFINRKPEYWYTTGGLLEEVLIQIVMDALLSPLYFFTDPIAKLKRLYARTVNRNNPYWTQEEFNMLQEGLEFYVPGRIAILIRNFIVTFIYMTVFPAGGLLCLIGLGIHALADWTYLLRFCKRPYAQSGVLVAKAVHVTKMLLPLVPGLSIFFLKPHTTPDVDHVTEILGYTALGLSLASIFIPMRAQERILCTHIFQPGQVNLLNNKRLERIQRQRKRDSVAHSCKGPDGALTPPTDHAGVQRSSVGGTALVAETTTGGTVADGSSASTGHASPIRGAAAGQRPALFKSNSVLDDPSSVMNYYQAQFFFVEKYHTAHPVYKLLENNPEFLVDPDSLHNLELSTYSEADAPSTDFETDLGKWQDAIRRQHLSRAASADVGTNLKTRRRGESVPRLKPVQEAQLHTRIPQQLNLQP